MEEIFEMPFLRLMFKEHLWIHSKKKTTGISLTWWWSEIGTGYCALRTLAVAFFVRFERNRQCFGFWCEPIRTLGPTEPGKYKIEVEEQSPHSSYLFNLKNCSKPFLSNGEEVSLFALAVLPGVSQTKCWAGHHQGGTGTHLLQHVSCKCSYYLDVVGFRNELVDHSQQNLESCQMGEGWTALSRTSGISEPSGLANVTCCRSNPKTNR